MFHYFSATQNRAEGDRDAKSGTSTAPSGTSTTSSKLPLTTWDEFCTNWDSLHQSTMDNILKDPFLTMEGSYFGNSILLAAEEFGKDSQPPSDVKEALFAVFCDIGKYHTWTYDRERLVARFHAVMVSESVHQSFQSALSGFDTLTVQQFMAQYLSTFYETFMGRLVAAVTKESDAIVQPITEREKIILEHVSGYLVYKLKATYRNTQESVVLERLETKGTKGNASWTKKINRGGLTFATTEFVSLVMLAEGIVRQLDTEVTTTYLDLAIETLMANPLVTQQWENIVVPAQDTSHVLEHCLKHFLTVRGFAVARRERCKIQSGRKALRKSLR